jgi:hypothetical protein
MTKKLSLKKRLDELFTMLKEKNTRRPDDGVKQQRKKKRAVIRLLAKPLNTAFEETGLDAENDDDWKKLAVFLSAAVFGGRGPGHPKRWSTKKLRRLTAEFDKIRVKHPSFTEERCCKELIRESGGEYNKVTKATTLRRVLQTAKRQQSLEREIASLKSNDGLAGVSKLTKGKY